MVAQEKSKHLSVLFGRNPPLPKSAEEDCFVTSHLPTLCLGRSGGERQILVSASPVKRWCCCQDLSTGVC